MIETDLLIFSQISLLSHVTGQLCSSYIEPKLNSEYWYSIEYQLYRLCRLQLGLLILVSKDAGRIFALQY